MNEAVMIELHSRVFLILKKEIPSFLKTLAKTRGQWDNVLSEISQRKDRYVMGPFIYGY